MLCYATTCLVTSIGSFCVGISGHVVMDELPGREPSFVLKGFTNDGKLTEFLLAEMYKDEGDVCALCTSEELRALFQCLIFHLADCEPIGAWLCDVEYSQRLFPQVVSEMWLGWQTLHGEWWLRSANSSPAGLQRNHSSLKTPTTPAELYKTQQNRQPAIHKACSVHNYYSTHNHSDAQSIIIDF